MSGGLNLFKWGDTATSSTQGWKAGDYMLFLPDKGSPAANWKQNSGALRSVMKNNEPIYDSYRNFNTGLQKSTGGFLNAERNLLESRGWIYDSKSGAYHPPSN